MTDLNSRLPGHGASIFSTMSKLAQEVNALNLSQGFPDFNVSEELIDLVHQNMRLGHNQYAPMPGLLQLREAIASVIMDTHSCQIDPEAEITITSGATEALFAAILAVVHPGDEVILFDPAYDSYEPAIRLAGGHPVHIALSAPTYAVDWNRVEASISSKTRLIIINTPHNPTGTVLDKTDLETLQSLAIKHDLIVLSDEVYERILFDQIQHESVLRYEALAQRSVAVYSFGKTYHATGWKVGYAIAPEPLTREIQKIHQFLTFSVNTPVQYALATYMQDRTHLENLGSFYQAKRDYFTSRLQHSRFTVLPCKGTYFQLLSYEKISDKSELDMAEHLTVQYGIASIPTSPFYQDKVNNRVLRFCFAKAEETLDQAAEILCRI